MDLEGHPLDLHPISMQTPTKLEYKMDKWKHLVSKKIKCDGIDMEYGWGIGLKVDKLMETSKSTDYREENFLLEV